MIKIREFLEGETRTIIEGNIALTKVDICSPRFEYIYEIDYTEGCEILPYTNKLEILGIWDRSRRKIIIIDEWKSRNRKISEALETQGVYFEKVEDLKKEVARRINSRVEKEVAEVRDEIIEEEKIELDQQDMEYEKEEIIREMMKNNSGKRKLYYDGLDWLRGDQLLEYQKDKEGFILEKAKEVIERQKETIVKNLKLREYGEKVRKEINQNATLIARKAIFEAIPQEAKTLNIIYQSEGRRADFKMENKFYANLDGWYTQGIVNKKERDKFEKEIKDKKVYYDKIEKITYKRKTIFDRKSLNH